MADEDPLPPGWEREVDEEGDVYYVDPTGETQWEHPQAQAAQEQMTGAPVDPLEMPTPATPRAPAALPSLKASFAAAALAELPTSIGSAISAVLPGGPMQVAPKPDDGGGEDGGSQAVCGELCFKESGRACKALFIPEGVRINAVKMTALLKQWGLDNPSIMVSCDAGTVHPKEFAAPKLVALPSFSVYWADAQQHAEGQGGCSKEDKEAFALGVINDVIFLKLVTIFSAVLDAAEIAGNWLVVDRCSAKSPAAELLIEAAMVQTLARPVILVVDALNRLKNFKGESGDGPIDASTASCMSKLESCKKGAVPLGVDDAPAQVAVNQFYALDSFMDSSAFNELPLPRPPEKAHLSNPDGTMPNRVKWQYHYLATFFGGGSHYIVCDNPNDAPDLSCLGPFGYIAANGQALMYPRLKQRIQAGESLVMLHNTGGVTQAFTSLRKAMLSSMPPPDASQLLNALELVSPAAWTKQFGLPEIHMMKELAQRAPMLLRTTVVAVDVMKDSSEETLSVLTCCFAGGGGVPELGLGEAEMLCILTAWKRHMTLITNAKAYERMADFLQLFLYLLAVVTTLTAVIYSVLKAADELADANAGGEAEGERRLQQIIYNGCSPFLPPSLPPSLPPLLPPPSPPPPSLPPLPPPPDFPPPSPFAPPAPPAPEPPFVVDLAAAAGGGIVELLGLIMVLLPIIATFLGTIKSKVRPREKWSTCLMAANQIVCQIYYYRLRTDKYDVNKPSSGDEEEEVSPKMKNAMARLDFVKTCAEIYSNAISTEVSKGGALKIDKVAKLQHQREADRQTFQVILHRYVKEKLYGLKVKEPKKKVTPKEAKEAKAPPKKLKSKAEAAKMLADKKKAAEKMLEKEKEKKKDDGDDGGGSDFVDDLVSQMDIETYIDCRVRPITDAIEKRAPTMSRRFNALEGLGLIANTSGAVLAIIELADWVAITVAIASVSMALNDYFYIPSQLAATNRAVQDLHNLLVWWDSLSLVQRKTRAVKLRCASTVEGAVLALCASRTAVSPALPNEQVEDEEEEKK